MRGRGIPSVLTRLRTLARFGLGLLQSFEIVPLGIVFGSVALAEVPSVWAMRRLGRRTIAGLVAPVAVAQANVGRLTRAPIAAPARKSPVERALRPVHDLNPQESIGCL